MESHYSVTRLETLWPSLPTGLSSALVSQRTSMFVVAGVSLPLSKRLILQVAPKNCWLAVGPSDPGESRSLQKGTLMQAKVRLRMWDKAGSEPGAISGHRV